MTARRRHGMRRLVDNTVELVSTGEISPNVAAQKLLENGVPVAVIGRVLSGAVVAKSAAAQADKTVAVEALQTKASSGIQQSSGPTAT